MKFTPLIVLLEISLGTYVLSSPFFFPNIQELSGLVQSRLGFTDKADDKEDLLSMARNVYGDLPESHSTEILNIWESLKTLNLYDSILKELNRLKSPISNGKKSIPTHSVKWDAHITNQKFPNHQLRVKKTNPEILGLDTVKQYTGYIDVVEEDKHLFYWFFESRNDPKNDPIVLWINGGPGCSSTTGLFFELGPSSISEGLKPVYNPYSWNNNASVIFLDQPAGTGYSYSSKTSVSSTDAAAKDFYIFLELFFQKFPEYRELPFHIAGESYAGHFIPRFASEILNQENRSFNLSSILIGNGITDPLTQIDYYKPMACGEGGYPAVIDEELCDELDTLDQRCSKLIASCYKYDSPFVCTPAYYCLNQMFGFVAKAGVNVYDVRDKCGDNCYPEQNWVSEYLSLNEVKQAVGAELDEPFQGCDGSVFSHFFFSGDGPKPFHQYIEEVLDKDLPVLLFEGDKDYICNWLGNQAMAEKLEWHGAFEYSKANTTGWLVESKAKNTYNFAGTVKSADKLTFLRVFDAGHMVPHNQPENSLAMLNSWIFNGEI